MPFDPQELFPSSEYIQVGSVPVFKPHSRLKGGRKVEVTPADLERIAYNHNHKFETLGIAVPLTLGHTLDSGPDGAEVPETEQPPVIGWSVNYRTGKLANGEDALYCDWYVQKRHADKIKEFPARSVEYFPSRQTFWPVALLKSSAPELDLPIIKYADELKDDPDRYRFSIHEPIPYSSEKVDMNPDEIKKEDQKMEEKDAPKKEDKPESKEMDKAKKDAEKGSVQDKSDLSEIKEQLAQIMAVMPDLLQLVQLMKEEPEGQDAMQPADQPAPDSVGKGKDKPDEKDSMKNAGVNPVKFESASPSDTNCSIPSFEKDKNSMSDEVVKYKNELDKVKADLDRERAKNAASEKVTKKLHEEYKKNKAKELVAEIESVCKYRSEKAREQDLEMLAKLDDDSAKQYVEMAKERYERRLPDADGVEKANKYSVTQEPDLNAKTPEEAYARIEKILASGMSREEWYKSQVQNKK